MQSSGIKKIAIEGQIVGKGPNRSPSALNRHNTADPSAQKLGSKL